MPSSGVRTLGGSEDSAGWLITLKTPDSEALQSLGKHGFAGLSAPDSEDMAVLEKPMKTLFGATPAINGRKSVTLEELAPYLTTAEEKAAYERMIERKKAASN